MKNYFFFAAFPACSKALMMTLKDKAGLIVGINKYSHDVSVCICDSTGKFLFAGEKERITRRKHDGGDASEIVAHALECIGATTGDVTLVVSNNHHFRIKPFEKRLPWNVDMNVYPPSYLDEDNLLKNAKHIELSHHLAHAWGSISQCPFDEGIVVVMDGMGESYSAMIQAFENGENDYVNDLQLQEELKDHPGSFQSVPRTMKPHVGYREAESVYIFDKNAKKAVRPFFKRWTEERSPPELYNHGFENMESMGAIYSRISSHIFGDWNACGKVMGLAPWVRIWPKHSFNTAFPNRFMEGNLMEETGPDRFKVNWDVINALPHGNRLNDENLRSYYAAISNQIQSDLEKVALEFMIGLKHKTQAQNLCICGGVALNSVLNGRIAREAGFERVFFTNHPGDEGISVGCAAYGLAHYDSLIHDSKERKEKSKKIFSFDASSRSPYQGKEWTDSEIVEVLEDYSAWIDVSDLSQEEEKKKFSVVQEKNQSSNVLEHSESIAADLAASFLADGKIIGWFQGRSEFGPRALGNRSILANPRNESMIRKINSKVKMREDFRPFAPSVLESEVSDWFSGIPEGGSPYMSLTVSALSSNRAKIPAVCHVDGTSRIQTVSALVNPSYHKLISSFFKATGIPMVLNTSFNIKGEPIVDSPEDAIKSFLNSNGGIDVLFIHHYIIKRKPFPVNSKSPKKQLKLFVPSAVESFMSEVMTRESQETVRVRVMLPSGEWIELEDDFQLMVLEAVDSESSVLDIIDRFTNEDESMEPVEVIKALESLYELRLIAL